MENITTLVDLFPDNGSLTTDMASVIVDVRGAKFAAVDLTWSGGSSIQGTFSIVATNDPENFDTNKTAYSFNVASDSGAQVINLGSIGYGWFQVQWNQTSGSGGTVLGVATLKP